MVPFLLPKESCLGDVVLASEASNAGPQGPSFYFREVK